MAWWSTPQPQEDDVSVVQPPAYEPVDPDRANSEPPPLFDETCEVAPPPPKRHDDWPPIWQ